MQPRNKGTLLVRYQRLAIVSCALLAATSIGFSTAAQPAGETIADKVSDSPQLTTLATAIELANLGSTLGGGEFTVFAPTDQAFEKLGDEKLGKLTEPEQRDLLRKVLTYHVVPGKLTAAEVLQRSFLTTVNGQRLDITLEKGTPRVDRAAIVKTDIICSNGVVHLIDGVLTPATVSIAQTAKEAGGFKTLLAAAKAASLVETLSSGGPYTVFAPTDEAFAKLGKNTIANLLKPENREQLAQILTYHVVPGSLYATAVSAAETLPTAANQNLRVRIADGRLTINDSSVLKTDIEASNGIIHVIDTVLIPSKTAAASASVERSPRGLIELAIERGAPIYNDGNAGACAAIYEVTLQSLATFAKDDATRELADATLKAGRNEKDETERAWIFRRGLDRLFNDMSRGH
jgi:uncharacterized surface protein with fasciclin (FAS1) repeats